MQILPLKTGALEIHFNLINKIEETLRTLRVGLQEGDILVVSSKIMALSQGRVADLNKIKSSKTAKKLKKTRYGLGHEDPRVVELCLREADFVVPGKMLLAMKNNILIPSAGIDLSNIPDGQAVLWPEKPWEAAKKIRNELNKKHKLKNFGIVVCDSHCQMLRWGTTGIALSWAGFEGIEDCRGKKDIYGKKLAVTKKAVADNLASSAMIVMGEAGEKIPFVIARNAPVKFTNRSPNPQSTFVEPSDCIFGGIYNQKFLHMLKSKRK